MSAPKHTPCPFCPCGGRPKFMVPDGVVCCLVCASTALPETWNTRAEPPEPPEVAALVEAVDQIEEMNGEAFWSALRGLPVTKFNGWLRDALAALD